MNRSESQWMWAQACVRLDRAERLQRQFFEPAHAGSRGGWEPPVDVFESAHRLWVVVALPGVRAEDIEIVFEGTLLSVVGHRAMPPMLRDSTIHRLELPAGRFERQIGLRGRFELIDRKLEYGCLTLGLRKLGQTSLKDFER